MYFILEMLLLQLERIWKSVKCRWVMNGDDEEIYFIFDEMKKTFPSNDI